MFSSCHVLSEKLERIARGTPRTPSSIWGTPRLEVCMSWIDFCISASAQSVISKVSIEGILFQFVFATQVIAVKWTPITIIVVVAVVLLWASLVLAEDFVISSL